MRHPIKILLLILGWLSVVLGLVGVFLPVLPTTPFLLVAAWAFAQSSPQFREWLVSHRLLGPYIRDWQEKGSIPLGAKLTALAMMSLSLAWLVFWSNLSGWIVGAVAICLAAAATFILTRPTAAKRIP